MKSTIFRSSILVFKTIDEVRVAPYNVTWCGWIDTCILLITSGGIFPRMM